MLHNKYDTLLGISELVYIHILLLDTISRPGHPIVGSIIHCYTQAFYALCALSTTTVMQITEYNLLSQSTNVYPLAPKDQCVRVYDSVYVTYAHRCMYIAHTHTYVHNTNIHTYECVLRRCRDKWNRWVNRSRLLVDRISKTPLCSNYKIKTRNDGGF